jgi:hypothetical protein
MTSCRLCGWTTVPELVHDGLCLTCSEYRRRSGADRPPPADREHVHRGETWPGVSDPRVREMLAAAWDAL